MRQTIITFIYSILISSPSFAAELSVPDNVVFDKAVEYSNSGNQHLHVDLEIPKVVPVPFPGAAFPTPTPKP